MKHTWIQDEDGDTDVWQFTQGEYHNGPKCATCGFEFCHHCHPEGYDTECGAESLGASDAKLDMGMLALEATIRQQFRRG